MSSIKSADHFLDKCNRLYHESIKYVDIGLLPFIAVSRRTHNSRLVQLCDRVTSFLIYPVNLLLSLYSFIRFIILLPVLSISISFIRILRPTCLRTKIPFLLEPRLILGKKLFFIEPFVFQDLSISTYFKFVFTQLQATKTDLLPHRILLLDSPVKLLSIHSYNVPASASLIPCFGGILQNLTVLFSQTCFLLKFTIHLCRSNRDLLLPWLCVFPRVYSSWSFSLVFLQRFLSYYTNTHPFRPHTYVLYEGLLRDILYSRYLPSHSTTFYSHTPFFSKSEVFFTNLLHINSSKFIFEESTAISFFKTRGFISHQRSSCDAPPPFDAHINEYKFTQPANNCSVIDFHSHYAFFKPPSFCSIDDLCKSFNSSCKISILLLPQGFVSESSSMISMIDELLIKRPFLRPMLKVYISLHPVLRHNKSLIKQIQRLGLCIASNIPNPLHNPLVTLCGGSSSFNRFSAHSIYPLAYLPSHQYSDSVFSPYILSHIQQIVNSQSLIAFTDYLLHLAADS
jgi:hypothetical protein